MSDDILGPEPIRFSRLSKFARSAAHYECSTYEETRDMRIGTAVHFMVLGGERPLVVFEGGDRRGKKWEEFRDAQAPDTTILTQTEWDIAEPIAESVQRHTRAMELLSGTREKKHLWKWLGRYCRGTPDSFTDDILADLKTTRCSDPRRFPFEARSRYYQAQLAWYQNGLMLSGLEMPSQCYIVAVEKTAPYPVVVYDMTTDLVEQGLRTCVLWMERLKVCEQTKCWPAYAESDVTLDVAENELDLDFAGLEEETAAQ